jgi:hypothetical protein
MTVSETVISKSAVLEDVGIDKNSARRGEDLAAIPHGEFVEMLRKIEESDREAALKTLVDVGRSLRKAAGREEAKINALATHPGGGDIHTGDLGLLYDLVPDDSADLFFTDPPTSWSTRQAIEGLRK